ncbi:hypothetical protein ElyMa_005209200 [Elysia marginata]|uniref:Uncharacterized protein n=1 Tax=Elysia marginata TaxID=1093978 RepID=A0AAV4JX57_9GAST|nr:hypothetical protein ElyMa_005209200 [Elysia marginata]
MRVRLASVARLFCSPNSLLRPRESQQDLTALDSSALHNQIKCLVNLSTVTAKMIAISIWTKNLKVKKQPRMYIPLALSLVVFSQTLCRTESLGLEPKDEEGELIVKLDASHEMVFSSPFAKKFYKCLCSSDTDICRIVYSLDVRRNQPETSRHMVSNVYKTRMPKRQSFSDIAGSKTFVCEKPELKDESEELVSCDRDEAARCDNGIGFHKLEFFDSSCSSGCINLCWNGYNVSYRGAFSRNLPEKGRCESAVNSLSSSSTTIPANARVSDVTTKKYQKVKEDSLPVAMWVVLGCILIIAAAIVIAVVMYRRRKLVDTLKARTRRRPSFLDIKPYACSEAEVKEYAAPGTSNISPCVDATLGSLGECDAEYTTYGASGSVYCTIADGRITSSKLHTNCNTTENLGPNFLKVEADSSMHEQRITRRDKGKKPDDPQKDGSLYSKLNNGKMRSVAHVPKNIYAISNTLFKEGQIYQEIEEVVSNPTYTRLNSKTEIPAQLQTNVLETYNMAAGKFDGTSSKQHQLEDAIFLEETKDCNSLTKMDESIKNCSQYIYENCAQQDDSQCRHKRQDNQFDNSTSKNLSNLHGAKSGCQINKISETNGYLISLKQPPTEDYQLEDGDGPDCCSDYPEQDINSPDKVVSTRHQIHEYFELERNEGDYAIKAIKLVKSYYIDNHGTLKGDKKDVEQKGNAEKDIQDYESVESFYMQDSDNEENTNSFNQPSSHIYQEI